MFPNTVDCVQLCSAVFGLCSAVFGLCTAVFGLCTAVFGLCSEHRAVFVLFGFIAVFGFFLPNTALCSDCVQLCSGCVQLCSECVQLCSGCVQLCSDCVQLCSGCVQLCSECVQLCSDCVQVCSDCVQNPGPRVRVRDRTQICVRTQFFQLCSNTVRTQYCVKTVLVYSTLTLCSVTLRRLTSGHHNSSRRAATG